MTNISVNIPGDKTKDGLKHLLVQLNALEDPRLSDSSILRYGINAVDEKYVNVNSQTGEVMLSKKFLETNTKGEN